MNIMYILLMIMSIGFNGLFAQDVAQISQEEMFEIPEFDLDIQLDEEELEKQEMAQEAGKYAEQVAQEAASEAEAIAAQAKKDAEKKAIEAKEQTDLSTTAME